MTYLKVDTNALKRQGQELLKLSNDFDNLTNSFFERIGKISQKRDWIGTEKSSGTSSIQFIRKSLEEKANYDAFGKSLKQYGEQMISFASDINNIEQENRIGE